MSNNYFQHEIIKDRDKQKACYALLRPSFAKASKRRQDSEGRAKIKQRKKGP